ncbi:MULTISPECIES: hypothetical protein [Hymenobacter]|uniref:hypothetical protein n=1 Tax=Hymenobacter TaxID=89966 RepID=UPI0010584712|nr:MULTISPECIES: hypothetical protein [Hymenobacter]QIL78166.1 hypothetical protein G7064_20265 [Hymenobacter sp. HDW8]
MVTQQASVLALLGIGAAIVVINRLLYRGHTPPRQCCKPGESQQPCPQPPLTLPHQQLPFPLMRSGNLIPT